MIASASQRCLTAAVCLDELLDRRKDHGLEVLEAIVDMVRSGEDEHRMIFLWKYLIEPVSVGYIVDRIIIAVNGKDLCILNLFKGGMHVELVAFLNFTGT